MVGGLIWRRLVGVMLGRWMGRWGKAACGGGITVVFEQLVARRGRQTLSGRKPLRLFLMRERQRRLEALWVTSCKRNGYLTTAMAKAKATARATARVQRQSCNGDG